MISHHTETRRDTSVSVTSFTGLSAATGGTRLAQYAGTIDTITLSTIASRPATDHTQPALPSASGTMPRGASQLCAATYATFASAAAAAPTTNASAAIASASSPATARRVADSAPSVRAVATHWRRRCACVRPSANAIRITATAVASAPIHATHHDEGRSGWK